MEYRKASAPPAGDTRSIEGQVECIPSPENSATFSHPSQTPTLQNPQHPNKSPAKRSHLRACISGTGRNSAIAHPGPWISRQSL